MVGSALNIGPKLRILQPSSLDADLGVWEAMTTLCVVRNFKPGYMVVALEGTKFEDIADSYRPQMFVVTTSVKETAMLKDIRNDQPVCIRNPNQQVHVLNHYGLSSVDPNISNMIYPLELDAPSSNGGGNGGTSGSGSQSSGNSASLASVGSMSNGVGGGGNGGGGGGNGAVAANAAASTSAVASAKTAPPPKRSELIFNFMGFVWGTQ